MKSESEYGIRNGDKVWALLSIRANSADDVNLEGVYKSEAALVYDFSNNIIKDYVPEENASMVVATLFGHGVHGSPCIVGNREYFIWQTNIGELVEQKAN